MTKPDFEWTMENAPHEEDPWPTSTSGGAAGSQRPGVDLSRRKRQPWPRWAWLVLVGLAVSAIAGAYVFTQVGGTAVAAGAQAASSRPAANKLTSTLLA
ncbi:MAG: hypothetical protein ABI847_14020 [Anaerolineales bacterium]